MEPETIERVAEAEPPSGDRSAQTPERSLLTSETVQVRMVVVVASAATDVGENEHAEMFGAVGGGVMVSEAVLVPVPPDESVAVVVMVFAPVVVPVAAVMPVSDHVEPEVLVSAAAVEPPSAERLTVTVDRLLLVSVAEQVRSVVDTPLATTEVGEKEHVEIVGAGSVTVRVAVLVPVAAKASVAVIVMVLAPAVDDVATVMAERRHVEPDTRVSGSDAVPPIAVRSAVTVERLLLVSVTVQVRTVVVVPLAATEAGENEHAEMDGATLGAVTVTMALLVSVSPRASVAVVVMVFAVWEVPVGAVMPVRSHVEPDVFVRVAAAEPPMDVRSAVTVERLLLASVMVQVRVVAEVASAGRVFGEKEHEEMAGATLNIVMVSVPDDVPVAVSVSVAVTVIEVAPGVEPTAAVMPVRDHVEPDVLVRAAVDEPPMAERLAVTVERLDSVSVTVQVRVVAVVPSAAMVPGENEQAETDGAVLGGLTVREAVPESVEADRSVAVMVIDLTPVSVASGTVMPVRSHVEPDVLVRAAVVEPPMDERLAVTVERLLLASVTEQERVVVETPSAETAAGVNEHEPMTGATLNAVVVSVALEEPVADDESVAVVVMVFAPAAVPSAAVMPVRRHVVPETSEREAVVEPPMPERSAVTDDRLPSASETVHVSVEVVTPFAGMDAGENEHAETDGAVLGAVTASAAAPVSVEE